MNKDNIRNSTSYFEKKSCKLIRKTVLRIYVSHKPFKNSMEDLQNWTLKWKSLSINRNSSPNILVTVFIHPFRELLPWIFLFTAQPFFWGLLWHPTSYQISWYKLVWGHVAAGQHKSVFKFFHVNLWTDAWANDQGIREKLAVHLNVVENKFHKLPLEFFSDFALFLPLFHLFTAIWWLLSQIWRERSRKYMKGQQLPCKTSSPACYLHLSADAFQPSNSST